MKKRLPRSGLRPRHCSLVTIVACLFLVSACSQDGATERLGDYRERMERVLDVPNPGVVERVYYLAYPRLRVLTSEQPRITMGVLDLLSLRDCALHTLIAQRNSSLGRIAEPSNQLFHELDFLNLVPRCIEQLGDNDERLRELLLAAAEAKRGQLPAVIWQALLGSEEYRQFWQTPFRLGNYPQLQHHPADDALAVLIAHTQRWLSGDYTLERKQIEALLQQLLSADGGYAFRSLALQAEQLSVINAMLVNRMEGPRLCFGTSSVKATALRNVVTRFFVRGIQPWSAEVQARVYRFLPKARELEALLAGGEPEAFRIWRQQRDMKIEEMSQAPAHHVATLLPLMEQCNVQPGR